MDSIITKDVLIIGGGGAGLSAAEAAINGGAEVLVAARMPIGRGGSTMMATGYAAALGHADPRDTTDCHADDTFRSSCGLGDVSLIDCLVTESIPYLFKLDKYGVRFKKSGKKYLQDRGAGHTFPRSCSTFSKRQPGILQALSRSIESHPLFSYKQLGIIDLLYHNSAVIGAVGINLKSGNIEYILAKATVIATGGIGGLYKVTSNPGGLYGEGFKLAYNVGAKLVDLEFVQFQPYRIIAPKVLSGIMLASSTFEYGATLQNVEKKDILENLGSGNGPRRRDVVARAIFKEVLNGKGQKGGVLLVLKGAVKSKVFELNPSIFNAVEEGRVNLDRDLIVVSPQAHFSMGGIQIDKNGFTKVPGLYAAGEVTGGLHGANRLQDNALPELLVFGYRAGKNAARFAKRELVQKHRKALNRIRSKWNSKLDSQTFDRAKVKRIRRELRELMWLHVGGVRNEQGLIIGISKLKKLAEELEEMKVANYSQLYEIVQLGSAIHTGNLICSAALIRRESRGAHYRSDYPKMSPKWEKHLTLKKNSLNTGSG